MKINNDNEAENMGSFEVGSRNAEVGIKGLLHPKLFEVQLLFQFSNPILEFNILIFHALVCICPMSYRG